MEQSDDEENLAKNNIELETRIWEYKEKLMEAIYEADVHLLDQIIKEITEDNGDDPFVEYIEK